jgi:zinc transport system substrate-binding protein
MMRVTVLTLVLILAVLGCTRPGTPTERLPVVVTFYPLFEFAQRVGGDRVAVRVLVPAGVEPHDFEPTPRDVAALTHARVVIYNGAGFEPWLEKLLPEAPAAAVKVNTARDLPLYRGRDGGLDPHVWLDPVLAARQVESIVRGLSGADPEGRGTYEAHGRRVVDDLKALNTRFATSLSTCRRRTFITSHAAFGYLARRYGLTQVSISGLSPEAEPSPARLKEIVQEARRSGTQVIYYETLVSPRVAEVIAREVGARVTVLNPLEGLTADEQRDGHNYFTVMDENLRALADGLDCR